MGIVIVFIHSLYSVPDATEAVIVAEMICHHWHLPVIVMAVSSPPLWDQHQNTVMLLAVKYAISQHTSICFLHLHFELVCLQCSRSLTLARGGKTQLAITDTCQ